MTPCSAQSHLLLIPLHFLLPKFIYDDGSLSTISYPSGTPVFNDQSANSETSIPLS